MTREQLEEEGFESVVDGDWEIMYRKYSAGIVYHVMSGDEASERKTVSSDVVDLLHIAVHTN